MQESRRDAELDQATSAQNGVFATDDEKLLFERLTEQSPHLGKMFYSALYVLRRDKADHAQNTQTSDLSDANPDRIAQSAHSVRETLLGAEREVMSAMMSQLATEVASPPHTGTIGDGSGQNHKLPHLKKIQLLSDPGGHLPKHLSRLYKDVRDLHDWFTNVSHHGRHPPEWEYSEKLDAFTRAMNRMLEPHFKITQEIDAVLKRPEQDLDKIEALIYTNWQAYSYFFKNASSKWLDVLIRRGTYFVHAPGFVLHGGAYKPLIWPESRYLERVAGERPELVMKTILNVHIGGDYKNHSVLADFAKAASRMPPSLGKKIADKAIREHWHRNAGPYSSWVVADAIGVLAESLVAEEFDAALKLCSRLLYLNNDDKERIRGYLDDYNYQQVLEKTVPVLVERDTDLTLGMLCGRLQKVAQALKDRHGGGSVAFSFWHGSVGNDVGHSPRGRESSLVAAIRKALERSEKRGVESLAESLKVLDSYDYPIFLSIKMHFYAKHPSYFVKEIRPLVDSKFDVKDFEREYCRMLQYGYQYFDDETKKILRKKISEGPSIPTDDPESSETDRKIWTLKKLSPLQDVEEFKHEYESLKNTLNKHRRAESKTHDDLYSNSPASLEDDMSAEEVIRFLQSYESTTYSDKNCYKFKYMVSRNPLEYCRLAKDMHKIPSAFLRGFFDILSDSNIKPDWEPVLELCRLSLNSTWDDRDLDYLLNGCGNMLRKNLEPGKIPFKFRQNVYIILDRATKLALSSPSSYEESRGVDVGAFNECINSGIGQTTLAIIQYSFWCSCGLKAGDNGPDRLVPEAKSALESMLNQRPSDFVHAAMGFGFASLVSLDRAWALSHAKTIFTREHPSGSAAWESYVWNRAHLDSFDMLYRECLYRLGATSKLQTLTMTADHVAVAYLNGLKTDELIDSIINKQKPSLLSHLVRRVGQYASRLAADDASKAALEAFVSRRAIMANPSAGWLFLSNHGTDQARLSLLRNILSATGGKLDPVGLVIEDVKSMACSRPVDVAECMRKIVSAYKNDDGIIGMLTIIDEALQTAFDTKNAEAVRIVRRVANDLGAHGFDQFDKFS